MIVSARITVMVALALGTRVAMPAPTGVRFRDSCRTQQRDSLYSAIAAADSALFTAFNERDLPRLRSFFARDLEFCQDNEGVENYAQTIRDFDRMFGQPTPIRRDLVPGSLEVYPIKNYGAMEVGRHRFCHVEDGRDECGTFSFVHIWRRAKTGWQISRVISYGH